MARVGKVVAKMGELAVTEEIFFLKLSTRNADERIIPEKLQKTN